MESIIKEIQLILIKNSTVKEIWDKIYIKNRIFEL